MSLPRCKSRHKCVDGGEGECTQPDGHYGRHLCSSCLALFTSGEAIHLKPPGESAASDPESAQRKEIHPETEHRLQHTAGKVVESPAKRCEHSASELCPECTSENCPDIVETCPSCHNRIDENIDVCAFCGGPLCSSCREASERGGVPCR